MERSESSRTRFPGFSEVRGRGRELCQLSELAGGAEELDSELYPNGSFKISEDNEIKKLN